MLFQRFSDVAISEAEKWLDCREDPGRPNRSLCVDQIHQYGWTINNDPWCAQFMFMVIDKAAKKFGVTNKLPKTASTVAMLNGAKAAGIRVDKKPAIGSIMFYSTGSGTGHVGIVVEVGYKDFATIEGNSGDRVLAQKHDYKDKFQFIHVEEMSFASRLMIFGLPQTVSIGLITAIVGGAFWAKKKYL